MIKHKFNAFDSIKSNVLTLNTRLKNNAIGLDLKKAGELMHGFLFHFINYSPSRTKHAVENVVLPDSLFSRPARAPMYTGNSS